MHQIKSKENVINGLAHTRVEDCYQCGKCTAGCPVAELMDLMPNQIVRLAQQGDLDRASGAASVWMCVACQTCSQRCPKNVDIAGVMDAVRRVSAARDSVPASVRRTLVFQRAFLDNIRRYGRLNELELIARFKTRSFMEDGSVPLLFKDAMLAPRLSRVHKMHLRGERVQDRDVVKRIFDRCVERV
jgi:heterodisulfide reductase subunit C